MGLEKNTAGKWVVFAYGAPDHASAGLAITGDAANITANVRIDGGAVNAVDDTNPTELEDGFYVFDITAAEANGDVILICPESASSDVIVIGAPAVVHTVAPNFNALGIESDGDLTKVNTLHGHTAQTGDTYALANGSAGFVAIDTVVDSILTDTGTTLPATLTTIEGKVDTVDTVVDTILVDTADIQPKFVGITLLNEWLGALMGSQAADATALSEIAATGAGSGTYDEANESLEALRARGDAAWTTGGATGNEWQLVDTTIATLASQTSFTLTAGSADDDAYNKLTIVVEDASTSTQKCTGRIADYTGATKTVTLVEDPGIFTMAATDKVYIFAEKDSTVAGVGAIEWDIEVEDTGNNVLEGVSVWITTDAAGANVVAGTLVTDALGIVTFYLNAGTYYVWRYSANYTFATNPTTTTVA